jgi:hypothetical protein
VVGLLGQDHELVAAHPCHQVAARRDGALQPLGHRDEQPVADVVAEAVVDALEPVEVQVAQPDEGIRVGAGERLGQPLGEERAVRQAGERVVQRLVAQPLLQLVPVGDVFDHRHRVPRLPALVAQQRDRHVGPDDGAVLAVVGTFQPDVVTGPVRTGRPVPLDR